MSSKGLLATLVSIFIVCLLPKISYAQNQYASISLSYPITIGDTFYSNYEGIANFQFTYSKSVHPPFFLNGTLDYTRSKLILNEGFAYESTTYLNAFKLILSAALPIQIGNIIILNPEFGLGYAYLSYRNEQSNLTQNDNGFTTRLALQFRRRIIQNFSIGILTCYDFTLLEKPDEPTLNTAFNKELHSVNIGFSGIFHF